MLTFVVGAGYSIAVQSEAWVTHTSERSERVDTDLFAVRPPTLTLIIVCITNIIIVRISDIIMSLIMKSWYDHQNKNHEL